MELWTGLNAAQAVDNGNTSNSAAFWPASAGSVTWPAGVPSGWSGGVRFEAITVRAAARVLRLQRTGVISTAEADFYLAELAEMDRYADRRASRSLFRLAQRHASIPTAATADRAVNPERAKGTGSKLAAAA